MIQELKTKLRELNGPSTEIKFPITKKDKSQELNGPSTGNSIPITKWAKH